MSMPGSRAPVDAAGAGDQVGQRAAHARIGPAGPPAPAQQLPVDAERRQLVRGQVDAAAVEVLADVAQEVRELERHAQRRGRWLGLRARHPGAEHRQHLQADHRGGAVHVDGEVVERRVLGDRGVHPHRRHEVREVLPVDVVAADGVGERGEHGVRRRSAVERGLQVRRQPVQLRRPSPRPGGRRRGRRRSRPRSGRSRRARARRAAARPAAAGWRGSRCARARRSAPGRWRRPPAAPGR